MSASTDTAQQDWFSEEVLREPALQELWARRPHVAAQLQRNLDAVLGGDHAALTPIERLSAAIAAASASGADDLVDGYFALIETAWGRPVPAERRRKAPEQISDPRLREIALFAQHVAIEPARIAEPAYDRLRAVGLTESALVTLTLLVGFVSWQVRAAAGLQALAATR